jgi:large subunit ribosomal protein L29
MKSHEMRELTLEELKSHHDTLVDELVNLRVKVNMRQQDNPMRVRSLRREVARAKTVLREKQMGAAPGQKPGSDSAAG